jgi:hypothetical protein
LTKRGASRADTRAVPVSVNEVKLGESEGGVAIKSTSDSE